MDALTLSIIAQHQPRRAVAYPAVIDRTTAWAHAACIVAANEHAQRHSITRLFNTRMPISPQPLPPGGHRLCALRDTDYCQYKQDLLEWEDAWTF